MIMFCPPQQFRTVHLTILRLKLYHIIKLRVIPLSLSPYAPSSTSITHIDSHYISLLSSLSSLDNPYIHSPLHTSHNNYSTLSTLSSSLTWTLFSFSYPSYKSPFYRVIIVWSYANALVLKPQTNYFFNTNF